MKSKALDRRAHVITAPAERPIEKTSRMVEVQGFSGSVRVVLMSLPRIRWVE